MTHQCCEISYGNPMRGFLTREEKIELLQDYKKQLENEARGVAERIVQLEKED